jgi:hypothetical protein
LGFADVTVYVSSISLSRFVKDILSPQVTDARAAMAVYRLHRKEWDSGVMPRYPVSTKKRKRRGSRDTPNTDQGGERKGTSSVVVKNVKGFKTNAIEDKWWLALGTGHGPVSDHHTS